MLITELAKKFGLSRSTLIYYDRIGLLKASGRSKAGYRQYSRKDLATLETISSFRQAGLTIEDIRRILSSKDANGMVLQQRLRALGEEIRALRTQQHLLGKMLHVQTLDQLPASVDKHAWIEMLRAAGMDEAAMARWHVEFEQRAPEAHHEFLLSLGIPEHEAFLIREHSRGESKEKIGKIRKR